MPLSGASVLIVEDNWFVALSLADMLRDAGAVIVGPAASVAQALAFIRTHRIDVAILDFRLDDETASPVAHCLQTRSLPFFFYTGSPEAAISHPNARIVAKPSSGKHLILALKSEMTRPARLN